MLTAKEKLVLDELISVYSTDETISAKYADSIAGISGHELSP